MSTSKNYQIPFDANTGDILTYEYQHRRDNCVWVDNSKFHATMEFDDVEKSTYSDRMRFKDQYGKSFTMSMNEFVRIVKFMEFGILTGEFTYHRTNNKYGIKYLG